MGKKKKSGSKLSESGGADRGPQDTNFDAFDAGVFTVDAELRLVWANNRFIRMVGEAGREGPTLAGRTLSEFLIGADSKLIDEYKNVLRTGQPAAGASRQLVIGGQSHKVEMRIVPFQNDEGEKYVLTAVFDVADKVDRVAFESTIADLSARFINMPIDQIDRGIELGLKSIVEILDVDRAAIFHMTDDGEVMASHLWDESSFKPFPRHFIKTRFDWSVKKILSREMVVLRRIDDLPEEAVGEREYFGEMGMKSQLIIPLQVGGTVLGGLSIGAYREHQTWSEDFIQRFRLVGEIFASALMRRIGQSDLKRALDEVSHYRSVVNRSSAIAIRWHNSAEDPVEFVSENIIQFGYSADDLLSGRILWKDVVVDEDYPMMKSDARRFVDEGKMEFMQQYRIRTNTGEVRWIEDLSSCIQSEPGKISHVEGILLDITNRKIMEEALKSSEEEYRLVVENVNAHISIVDYQGKFLFVNQIAAKAHGLQTEEVIGRNLAEFFPDDLASRQLHVMREVIDTGMEMNQRMEIKIGDEWRWFDVNLQPYRKTPDSVEAALIIAADVTDKLEAEEALRAREEQYRMLIDNVQADIVLVDRDGVFQYVNESTAFHMGFSQTEMVGKRQHDFFPEQEADRQLRNIRNVIESGRPFHEEAYVSIQEQRRWLDINIQPYRDSNGRVTSAMIIAIDITNRKEAEKALKESEERFRLQFTSLPIPAYIWEYRDDDFILTSYNLAAVGITRGGITRFMGRKLSDMYGDAPDIIKDMHRCHKEKSTITREMPYYMVSTGDNKYLRLFYVFVPPNLVVAHTEDITESHHAREALQQAHDDLEIRVRQRTRELAEANEALEVEREALHQKNIALREILDQIEAGKQQMAAQIQTNINRIVMPILKSLERKVQPTGKQYTELLRSSLNDIASPLIATLETRFTNLTPRELEVCNMIKSGMSSKDIAETFHTSVQTVLKQRTLIRRKLGITNSQTNLASYLKSIE